MGTIGKKGESQGWGGGGGTESEEKVDFRERVIREKRNKKKEGKRGE